MLNRIKLSNFRKHRDTDLPLQQGLVVLRGLNEAGKSTLIEGICYALFGVKALRSSLEEAVTWGEAVATLKADLWVVVDGVEYHIRRGKSGAEVNYDGGRVTGQNEVTNFMCTKMRVDPVAAARLMLSNQNEIRGALEAGPKATTELIEKLSEFDQLDTLVERIQSQLQLGSTAPLEQRLADAEKQLAELGEAVKPDTGALNARISELAAQHQAAQAAVEALEGDAQKAQAQVDLARSAQAAYDQAVATTARASKRFTQACESLSQAQQVASKEWVWPTTEEADRQAITDLEQAQRILGVYCLVSPHLQGSSQAFPGTSVQLLEQVGRVADELVGLGPRITRTSSEVAAAKAQMSFGTCSFCGQDFSHLPEVAKKNAELQARIDAGEAQLLQDRARLAALKEEDDHLQAVARITARRQAVLDGHPDYLEVLDTDTCPPTLKWKGPDIDSLRAAEAELPKARAALRQRLEDEQTLLQAKAKVETLAQVKVAAEAELQQAIKAEELAEIRPDLAAAEQARDEVLARRRPLTQAASELQTAHRDAQFELRDAERNFATTLQRREHLEDGVTALKDQIKTTEFNNALLKRVRQCRPLIADKLWGIVLSAVSSYFSEMRGEKSEVTKDADGFRVGGHNVQSLSGSTLDILGLAIRVALTRTFLPSAPFMVLDEPCAAMDSTRTEATLGFVVGCGFRQVLLVTHEDTSEAVADHMVQI